MSFDKLLEELRNNTRLRLGIWLILAIVLGYSLLVMDDYRKQLATEHQTLAERLDKLETLVKQTVWTERATAAHALQVQVESKLWVANSKGLAQANVQAWLDSQLKVLKVAEPRLKVEAAVENSQHRNLWQVSGQIDGIFTPASMEQFLLNIATHPQWILVERLEIRQGQPSRFTMVVTAYFQAPQQASNT
ncbi:MAG: hypothetical protein RIS84_232 [Pseudomonadota bacterium]|jgi:hypothetical protein